MPNIVHQLAIELARVQALLPKLEAVDFAEAQELLRYARSQMANGSYDGMRDALSELEDFGRPKKPEPDS